jgi:hypothetical protein
LGYTARPFLKKIIKKKINHGRTWVAVTSSLILVPTLALLSQDGTRPLPGPDVPKKPNIGWSDPKNLLLGQGIETVRSNRLTFLKPTGLSVKSAANTSLTK